MINRNLLVILLSVLCIGAERGVATSLEDLLEAEQTVQLYKETTRSKYMANKKSPSYIAQALPGDLRGAGTKQETQKHNFPLAALFYREAYRLGWCDVDALGGIREAMPKLHIFITCRDFQDRSEDDNQLYCDTFRGAIEDIKRFYPEIDKTVEMSSSTISASNDDILINEVVQKFSDLKIVSSGYGKTRYQQLDDDSLFALTGLSRDKFKGMIRAISLNATPQLCAEDRLLVVCEYLKNPFLSSSALDHRYHVSKGTCGQTIRRVREKIEKHCAIKNTNSKPYLDELQTYFSPLFEISQTRVACSVSGNQTLTPVELFEATGMKRDLFEKMVVQLSLAEDQQTNTQDRLLMTCDYSLSLSSLEKIAQLYGMSTSKCRYIIGEITRKLEQGFSDEACQMEGQKLLSRLCLREQKTPALFNKMSKLEPILPDLPESEE